MSPRLEPGMAAPAFSLPRDGSGQVSLSEFRGRKLVLYFYPKADTSGCTVEAKDFSRLLPAFRKAGADVVGVSADAVSKLDKFKAKHDLTVALGSDETHEMLSAYGAWGQKSMYGRLFTGVLRSTVLIDAAGKVAQVWPKVKVPGHADQVLAAVQALDRPTG